MMKYYGKQICKNYGSGTRILIGTTLNDIKSDIVRWKHNRPEDQNRVDEISQILKDTKNEYLDGIVYSWNKDSKLQIYDGWTRLSSLLKSNQNLKLLLVIDYTPNEDDICKHFNLLNKSVPVPLLYFDNDTDSIEKRKLIEGITSRFCKMYKPFVSTARTPRRGNFCRDTFFDILSSIITTRELVTKDPVFYIKKLLDLNDKLSIEFNDVKHLLPKKAVDVNFYIFTVVNYKTLLHK